jgi:hypothetical protein
LSEVYVIHLRPHDFDALHYYSLSLMLLNSTSAGFYRQLVTGFCLFYSYLLQQNAVRFQF